MTWTMRTDLDTLDSSDLGVCRGVRSQLVDTGSCHSEPLHAETHSNCTSTPTPTIHLTTAAMIMDWRPHISISTHWPQSICTRQLSLKPPSNPPPPPPSPHPNNTPDKSCNNKVSVHTSPSVSVYWLQFMNTGQQLPPPPLFLNTPDKSSNDKV